jgi:hypothetical protein
MLFIPLLISVEARLIFDSQGLILPATLSDEVASVRQIGRTEGASLRERLVATATSKSNSLGLTFETLRPLPRPPDNRPPARFRAERVRSRCQVNALFASAYFLGCETLRGDEATKYLPSSPFSGSRSSEKFEAPPEPPISLIRARKK